MFLFMFGMTSTEPNKEVFSPDRCLAAIAEKSKEALEELYSNMADGVFGYALSILKNHHEAQDVQQEVFVKIWSCASQYRPGSNARAWIYTITKNLAMTALRKSMKSSGAEVPEIPHSDASVEDRMALNALLNLLGEEERQIVMLHTQGMKHREIASVMQLPLSTILSKYNRSLKKLKKCLEDEFDA